MSTRLRIDPWDPDFGGSVEIPADLAEPPASVDLGVEGVGWIPVSPAFSGRRPTIAFLDGVRRIDVRLFAEDDGLVAPALAGSWAVGVAWSAGPPRIDRVTVGRVLVVGGGLDHEALVARLGSNELRYDFSGVAGTGPMDPIQGLQNAMRDGEADLARRVFETDEADLLLLDGPLTYTAGRGAVVGLVKRQSRAYLPADAAAIFAALAAGDRTPLFRVGEQRLERYSWYLRLAPGRPIDGTMTGIVRLEVSTDVGLDEAVRLADLTAGVLPRFATAIGRDPRAPQNLYPVARLEAVLKHRMGDPALIKRSLEVLLWERHV